MKTVLLVLSSLFGASLAVERTFSVHIKGTFQCREQPYVSLPLDIYQQSSTMNYHDFMARFTDGNGAFDLTAYIKTDQYVITPYIVIRHSCWQNKDVPQRCNRKIVWPIPMNGVTSGQAEPDEKKVFDIGTVDLSFKHPNEVAVICGM